MDIRIKTELTAGHMAVVIRWVNTQGADFVRQWGGSAVRFPVDEAQMAAWKTQVFSLFAADEFVGMLQKIREEVGNVHIGRFIVDPARTGQGVGRAALRACCAQIFADPAIQTVSLNVFADNRPACRLYAHSGFVLQATDDADGRTRQRMVLRRTAWQQWS